MARFFFRSDPKCKNRTESRTGIKMNSHEYSTKRRHKNMQTSFTYTHLVKIQPIKIIPNEYSDFALIPETETG